MSEVLSTPDSPLVWSVSYGEDLSQVTADYARRLDSEFKKMATLGVSVLFASGDSGVYSRTGGTSKFHPSYPACLPSVTVSCVHCVSLACSVLCSRRGLVRIE